ncbi:unnamed protein product, partial [Allacma fusca]
MARSIARDQVISQFSFPLYVSSNTRTDTNICEDRNRQGALRTPRSLNAAARHKIDLFLILADRPNKDLSSKASTVTVEHYVLCKDLGSLF